MHTNRLLYQQINLECKDANKVVVRFGFYDPPTAKVIRRRDLGLKSHPKDCANKVASSLCIYIYIFFAFTLDESVILNVLQFPI